MPNSVWSSDRLVYRSYSRPADDAFLLESFLDPDAWMNRVPSLPSPTGMREVEALGTRTQSNLLAAIICLPTKGEDGKQTLTPIGFVGLFAIDPRMMHHRDTGLGINIDYAHRGKGYGTEAIRWAIYWAFRHAGMHRIEMTAYEWNTGACKLYPRMGFRLESTRVKQMWHDGEWWNAYSWAMLAEEWEELYGEQYPRKSVPERLK